MARKPPTRFKRNHSPVRTKFNRKRPRLPKIDNVLIVVAVVALLAVFAYGGGVTIPVGWLIAGVGLVALAVVGIGLASL